MTGPAPPDDKLRGRAPAGVATTLRPKSLDSIRRNTYLAKCDSTYCARRPPPRGFLIRAGNRSGAAKRPCRSPMARLGADRRKTDEDSRLPPHYTLSTLIIGVQTRRLDDVCSFGTTSCLIPSRFIRSLWEPTTIRPAYLIRGPSTRWKVFRSYRRTSAERTTRASLLGAIRDNMSDRRYKDDVFMWAA